jgi:hypothetical protein
MDHCENWAQFGNSQGVKNTARIGLNLGIHRGLKKLKNPSAGCLKSIEKKQHCTWRTPYRVLVVPGTAGATCKINFKSFGTFTI